MDNITVNLMPEHEIIVSHLRKSRDIGKHILKIVPEAGSAIIEHKIILITQISEKEVIKSTISLLPIVRIYKKNGMLVINDVNIATEENLDDYD